MASLLLPALAIAVIVVIGLIVVAIIREAAKTRSTGDTSPMVRLTLVIAASWALVSTIGAIAVTISTAVSEYITIRVPVRQFWPQPPLGVSFETADSQIMGGGFTFAELTMADLGGWVRALWALGQGLGWLVPGAVAALVAITCFQLLKGSPFAPVVARMSTITAIVVLVGGIAGQLSRDIAGFLAGRELGSTSVVWESEDLFDAAPLEHWWPQFDLNITMPWWPIAAALAFAALAAIVRYGTQLQRDTEGLV